MSTRERSVNNSSSSDPTKSFTRRLPGVVLFSTSGIPALAVQSQEIISESLHDKRLVARTSFSAGKSSGRNAGANVLCLAGRTAKDGVGG